MHSVHVGAQYSLLIWCVSVATWHGGSADGTLRPPAALLHMEGFYWPQRSAKPASGRHQVLYALKRPGPRLESDGVPPATLQYLLRVKGCDAAVWHELQRVIGSQAEAAISDRGALEWRLPAAVLAAHRLEMLRRRLLQVHSASMGASCLLQS